MMCVGSDIVVVLIIIAACDDVAVAVGDTHLDGVTEDVFDELGEVVDAHGSFVGMASALVLRFLVAAVIVVTTTSAVMLSVVLNLVDAAAFAVVWYIVVMMLACDVSASVTVFVVINAVVETVVRIEEVLEGNRHVT